MERPNELRTLSINEGDAASTYIIVGIHHPKPGKEQAVLDAIEKFGRAQRGHRGALTLFTWKDDATVRQ